MYFIALFLPSCISLVIRHNRNRKLTWSLPKVLVEYGILVLINTWSTMLVAVYVLHIPSETIRAFEYFSFFIKYSLVSSIIAFLIPYIEEVIRKYIKITFRVEDVDET